ncbi:beta-lactamase/transpeptidase-like protein [Ilyonectria sp. MPI-CAGE-AT-0026]|nr:beta-lactamase/transpeptidase-like protein [Ilyonectria sp. MPI-CAGE-AT-0026]
MDIGAATSRLKALAPAIDALCSISGNAGLSVGVSQEGRVIHRANFGFRDVQARTAPDSDTIDHLTSFSKVTVAAAAAHLVHQGKFGWETPIKAYFDRFASESPHVESEATIIDLLAHRTTLASKNAYITMGHQIHLVPKDQTSQMTAILEPTAETFRKDFNLAGNIVVEVAGESLGSFTKAKFFDQLGMQNTIYGVPPENNYAQCYVALDNGSPYHVPRPTTTDETSLAGAQGLKSNVNDLLAVSHQTTTGSPSTPGNPFVEASAVVTPHITVSTSPQEQTYGLRLVLTTLPGTLDAIGTNGRDLGSNTPVAARSANGNRVWYHNGSMTGGFSSVHVLPDEEIVIVVLNNTLALTDVPDFVGQMLIEAVLGEPNPNDYVSLAKQTAETHLKRYPEMRALMAKDQKQGTPCRPLEQYVGIKPVTLDLAHYEDDVFARPNVEREDDPKACMFPSWKPAKQKIAFLANEAGGIDRLTWQHDSYLSEGEVFSKDGGRGGHKRVIGSGEAY